MENIVALLDVHQPLFTILSYPMSGIELLGTVFNLGSVYLMARRQIWTWPLGLIGVCLFAALFYQIRLYGDFFEQIYYFGASLYGWWQWSLRAETKDHSALQFSSRREVLIGLVLTGGGGLVLAWVLNQLPVLLPQFFPEPPSYVYVDAITTSGSFVAMVLEAKRRIESWIYWTVINIAGIWLYVLKGVPFVAALYGLFLVLGVYGYVKWWTVSRQATR